MKKYRYLLIPTVCILTTFLLFRIVFIVGYVPSASMEPTLEKDSMILGLRLYGDLRTGDIVVFRHDGRLLVKRIAGAPGEVIDHNGAQVKVPENSYYVLGDNAECSFDSRYWGNPYVPHEDIIAKLLL